MTCIWKDIINKMNCELMLLRYPPPHFGKQEVGIWWVQKRFPRYGVPIWNLWPNILYMHIFRRIFLSNYWWQVSDIWSQASYRYAILWEAFKDPSDSYFLFANGTYIKLVTKYQISAINSWWEKCDEKCAYMFNVYKNQLGLQTGSRNLTGSKTLPTIWYTYITLVTIYQISGAGVS
jgi:hypothetical protein